MIQNVRCGLFLSKQQTNVLTENMYRWNNLCLFELDDQAIAQLHFRVMKCRKWHSLKKDVRPFITVTSNCDNLHTKYRHKHFKLMKQSRSIVTGGVRLHPSLINFCAHPVQVSSAHKAVKLMSGKCAIHV